MCRVMKVSQTSGFSIFFCQNGNWHHRGFIKFQNFKVSMVKMTTCVTLPSLAVFGQTISGR